MSGSDLGAEYPKCRLSVKLLLGKNTVIVFRYERENRVRVRRSDLIVKRIHIFWSRFSPPNDLNDREDSDITKTFSSAARFILSDE
jgi:hypothetical protein